MTTESGGRRRALMLAATGVDAAAFGLYLASAALFLVRVIGLSTTSAGLLLGVGGMASMAGAVPVARLTERFPAAYVLTGLFLLRGAAFIALAWSSQVWAAAVVITASGFLNRGIGPIIQAIALEGADERAQVRVLAANRALRNAGLAAGGLPIAIVVADGSSLGFRLMLTAAGVLAAAAAALAVLLPPSHAHSAATAPHPGSMGRDFLLLTGLYGALAVSGMVLSLGVPLVIVSAAGAPGWTVGLVQILNTGLVVALQVRASRGSEVPSTARRQMAAAAILSAVGCVLMSRLAGLVGDSAVAMIVLVILVLTAAELLVSSGGSGLMLTHVPPGQRARYLAVFNLGFGGATIVGPPLVGTAVAHQPIAWYALAAAFIVLGGAATRLQPGREFAGTASPAHPEPYPPQQPPRHRRQEEVTS